MYLETLSYNFESSRELTISTDMDKDTSYALLAFEPGDEVHLQHLHVAHGVRGEGVGSTLFSIAVACALARGCRSLYATISNERVASMFKRFPPEALHIGEPDVMYKEGSSLTSLDDAIIYLKEQRITRHPDDTEMVGSSVFVCAEL